MWLVPALVGAALAHPGTVELISADDAGDTANDSSEDARITPDGRYVAFGSAATNLAPGADFSGVSATVDIFLRDRDAGTTIRISTNAAGDAGDAQSEAPTVSDDGAVVAFHTWASDLLGEPANSYTLDVAVADVATGAIYAAHPRPPGTPPDTGCSDPELSGDGRYLAYLCTIDLAPEDDNHNVQDVYVTDLTTGAVELVSRATDGTAPQGYSWAPDISADGRYVAYYSFAKDIVAGDTNKHADVFVYDRDTMTTTRVSVSGAGVAGNGESSSPSISGDGRYVVFTSRATNLSPADKARDYDIFLHDRDTGRTSVVTATGNLDSLVGDISQDGRYVAVETQASNYGGKRDDNSFFEDIYVFDLLAKTVRLASHTPAGDTADLGSHRPSVANTGEVVFDSENDLDPARPQWAYQVFLDAP